MSPGLRASIVAMLLLTAPLEALGQRSSAENQPVDNVVVARTLERAALYVRNPALLATLDSLGWTVDSLEQHVVIVRPRAVACPMPVLVPARDATISIPVAKPDTLATMPIPTHRLTCDNPLFRRP